MRSLRTLPAWFAGAGLGSLLTALPALGTGWGYDLLVGASGTAILLASAAAVAAALLRRTPSPQAAVLAGFALGVAPITLLLLPGNLWSVCILAPLLLLVAVRAAPRIPAAGRLAPVGWLFLLLVLQRVAVGGTVPEAATVATTLPPAVAAPEASGPDVLLISIDTLRADAVVGRPADLALPNLDRLRAASLWADYALSSSNQTLPGHAGMLSGLDAMEHGLRENRDNLDPGIGFLSERFLESGWRTAAVISNAVIGRGFGFGRGFEVYDDSTVLSRGRARALADDLLARTWCALLQKKSRLMPLLDRTLVRAEKRAYRAVALPADRGRGELTNSRALPLLDQLLEQPKPYFFFLHYMDPHGPYAAPAPFDGSRTAGLPLAEPYRFKSEFGAGHSLLKKIEDGLAVGSQQAERAAAFCRALYLEEVAYLDRCLGEVLDRVERSGRPTVILFTADHGEHFGEYGLMEHSCSLYKELIRVPFFLAAPGVEAGRIDAVPQLRDVAPNPPPPGRSVDSRCDERPTGPSRPSSRANSCCCRH